MRDSLARRTLLGAALLLPRLARAAEVSVTIDNFTFTPAELSIPSGTRVTWTNRDDIPHTVTSTQSDPPFHSPALDTGDTFAVAFDKPGTFKYYCALHPHMQGRVVVT